MSDEIAFDLHGVLDTYPDLCMGLMKILRQLGYTIGCLSGPTKKQICNELDKLKEKGYDFEIEGKNIYSVVDSLKHWGVKFTYDDDGNPWCDEQVWWDSKARICKAKFVDMLIDDSRKYESAFNLTEARYIHINEFVKEK